MKAAFITLGCKVNQYETQAMQTLLRERGHTIVPFAPGADAYIINTCSVTSTGDKKSRNAVRRARKMGPEAVIAVCGCYSQLEPDAVESLGADLIGGSSDRGGFISGLERAVEDRTTGRVLDEPLKRKGFELLPPGGVDGRTRALLKVEDGCTNFCTYCVIPYARGPVRSLPLPQAAEQTRQLCASGYKEIVITGIEIASYGRDLPEKTSPAELFSAVCTAAGNVRIRLGSLEPRVVDREFCELLSRCSNLCDHFHLSLQSGCDDTLRRMGRKYGTERFFRSVELLREYFPGCAITTDLITGFPGESDGEFSLTMEFIRRCRFSAMHVFPYSERRGTKAAAMGDRVPIRVREERASAASAAAEEMRADYLSQQVGKVLPVLFEAPDGGFSRGHAPNYTLVMAPGEVHGTVCPTRITGSDGMTLTGEILS